jgi:hypothetical protein
MTMEVAQTRQLIDTHGGTQNQMEQEQTKVRNEASDKGVDVDDNDAYEVRGRDMQPMFALLLIPHVRLTLKNREKSNYVCDSFAKCHLCVG